MPNGEKLRRGDFFCIHHKNVAPNANTQGADTMGKLPEAVFLTLPLIEREGSRAQHDRELITAHLQQGDHHEDKVTPVSLFLLLLVLKHYANFTPVSWNLSESLLK